VQASQPARRNIQSVLDTSLWASPHFWRETKERKAQMERRGDVDV
jgi:hypothetical protein